MAEQGLLVDLASPTTPDADAATDTDAVFSGEETEMAAAERGQSFDSLIDQGLTSETFDLQQNAEDDDDDRRVDTESAAFIVRLLLHTLLFFFSPFLSFPADVHRHLRTCAYARTFDHQERVMKETGCTFDEARLELVMEQIRLAGIEAEAELDSIATTAAPLPDSSAAHGAHLHTFNHHHPATAATAALRSPSTVSRQFNVFFTVEGVDLEGYTTTSTKARPVTTLHPLFPVANWMCWMLVVRYATPTVIGWGAYLHTHAITPPPSSPLSCPLSPVSSRDGTLLEVC